MLKKVLYILASFVVGFLVMMTVITFNLYSVLQGNIAEAVSNKNYFEVSKYFSGIFDYDNKYTEEAPFDDGLHIEVYYSIFDGKRVLLDEEGEEVVGENNSPVTYDSFESGILIMIHNLPEDFKLEDTETTKGGVSIVFENEKELFFPFVISETNNFYNYATGYSVIPFSISYFDYLNAAEKAEISTDTEIESIKVTDGSNLKQYVVKTTGLTFENTLNSAFSEVIAEFNELQIKAAKGEEISKEVGIAFSDKLEKLVEANPNFKVQYNDKFIYSSSKFLVPVILSAVLFLAIDILIAWLIFRKKKPSAYIPPHQQKTPVKSEPEQFNRDVFNVVDYDTEEPEKTEETPKNEE